MLLFVPSTEMEKRMDFFDFFFPEQAQATHLRNIARSSNLSTRNIEPGQWTTERLDGIARGHEVLDARGCCHC